jgi:Holliday junction resolvase RusA-like endonuclease
MVAKTRVLGPRPTRFNEPTAFLRGRFPDHNLRQRVSPINIEIAGEPRGKGRPRFARSGHTYTPAATRAYESAIRYTAQVEMDGRPPLEGALQMVMTATFPVPISWSRRKREAALAGTFPHVTRPDVDNLLKTIDALNQIVFSDDKQITHAVVVKRYGERPCLKIEISKAEVVP